MKLYSLLLHNHGVVINHPERLLVVDWTSIIMLCQTDWYLITKSPVVCLGYMAFTFRYKIHSGLFL